MLTREFIIESAKQQKNSEDASTLLWKMRSLNIVNETVIAEANSIITKAKEINQKAIDYIYSFVPEEVKTTLQPKKVTGCFASLMDNRASLNAEIVLHTEEYSNITLRFDNINNCFYYLGFSSEPIALLNKHFTCNTSFNCWLIEKDFK